MNFFIFSFNSKLNIKTYFNITPILNPSLFMYFSQLVWSGEWWYILGVVMYTHLSYNSKNFYIQRKGSKFLWIHIRFGELYRVFLPYINIIIDSYIASLYVVDKIIMLYSCISCWCYCRLDEVIRSHAT